MTSACVVIGAGPGIGQAVAGRFAHEGYAVGLVARSEATVRPFSEQLRQRGHSAQAFVADAADEDALLEALGQAQATLGDIDVLVYNVGVLRPVSPSGEDVGAFVHDFRANVVGALVAVQAVLPEMRARGQGTILLTGGGLALRPSAGVPALSVGKAGLRSLALVLAEELTPENIHVTTVTVAGMVQPGTHFDPERIAEVYWSLHRQPREAWQPELLYAQP